MAWSKAATTDVVRATPFAPLVGLTDETVGALPTRTIFATEGTPSAPITKSM